jgi:hypothetical protein
LRCDAFEVADPDRAGAASCSSPRLKAGRSRSPPTLPLLLFDTWDRHHPKAGVFAANVLTTGLPRSRRSALGGFTKFKHDGFRILAERDSEGVTLHTRRVYDFADRFPLAVAAVANLPVNSCLIDGEAIVCDANGIAVFDLLRGKPAFAFACAWEADKRTYAAAVYCLPMNLR